MTDCETRQTVIEKTRFCRCFDYRATVPSMIVERYGAHANDGDADFDLKCQPCEGKRWKVCDSFHSYHPGFDFTPAVLSD